MVAISNLDELLSLMNPCLNEGEYVYITVSPEKYSQLTVNPLFVFQEEEGISLILKKSEAEEHNLSFEGVWGWITMEVHSDLAAVGFTAAFSKKLGDAGISVNVVAAYYHDHLFVPIDRANEAVRILT